MQIIFDTGTDSKLDMLAGIAALQAYMATYHGHETPVADTPKYDGVITWASPLRRATDAPILAQHTPATPQATAAQVLPAGDTASFTPGDLGAPSPADAAPSPIAPEVPQDGVPMPPSVASVPAPPSTVPEVPAAPSTSAPSGELDVNGLPWDGRIHASSKTRNADGSWRQRRNLSPVTLETVMAELRARAANPGNAALGDDAAKLAGLGMDPMSGQPLPNTAAVQHAAQVFAGTVPPPPVVATPLAPAAPDALTYDGFLAWVTPKMMDGSTPFDKVAAALSASGVSSLQELRDNPAAIPAVYQALGGV